MKEHILPKQAAMLEEDQFYSLFPKGFVKRKDWTHFHNKKVTIGRMVAYLHNKGYSLSMQVTHSCVIIVKKASFEVTFTSVELCDALWEAVVMIETIEVVERSLR
jgi:hypothetical protein